MTTSGWACGAVFLAVFALIASERVDKTKAALAGAALVLLARLVDQNFALHGDQTGSGGVDWSTLLLLIGTMIIVNIARRTGMFEWLAIKVAKLVRGDPVGVLLLLGLVTAALSALLNNVTTVVTIAPVAILICEALAVDPVPYLICVALASNVGGCATLIGNPPNMMIGSAAGLSFSDFLRVDAPLAALALAVVLAVGLLAMRRRGSRVSPEARDRVMEFDEKAALTDRPLLYRCLLVMGLTLAGFLLSDRLGLQPATIALSGAALLLLLDRESAHDALAQVEWSSIFFFLGLFIMVSALVETGVRDALGQAILRLAHGSLPALSLGLVWVSGGVCGMIDPTPYAATMIPLLKHLGADHTPVLWWALSLGANLGANLTLIAAASNVVVASISERAGFRITFRRFLKYGLPVTALNLALASLYLWLRFLR
jgi:Na+/H+ antiporter NhaD/arsenite permease-like protein